MKIWDTFRRWSGVDRPKRAARIKDVLPGRRDVLGSLRSRSLRVETFEQRLLLSITSPPGFDDLEQIVCPMTDYNYLSDSLSRAVYRASDLSGYDQEVLASTYQWVVGVNEAKASAYAPQLAATLNADFQQYAPVLKNATIWEFPEAMSWVTVANTLQSTAGIDYYYPLVAEKLVPMAIPNDPLFGNQWHLQNTGQTGGTPGVDANVISAWDKVTGAGVIIGIVDDSLQMNHPDLVSSIRADLSYDYRDGDNDPSPGISIFFGPDNHGTAVAGVAGAVGNNSLGVSGSAPAAQLAGIRLIGGFTTDVEKSGSLLHQIEQIDIYNNSWGPGGYLQAQGPLTLAAIETGVATGRDGLGSIYVFAAGNSRKDAANSNYMELASLRHTIAVAAIGADGTYSEYSNPGASLLISGHSSWGYNHDNTTRDGIVTTDRTGEDGYNRAGTGEMPSDPLPDIDYTSTFGGTSSAAPLVSGVIALMLEANPGLTYRDVQHILVETASLNDPDNVDWTQNAAGYHINHNYGFGAIDAAAAVDLAFGWKNVSAEIATGSGMLMVNMAIPDGNSTGVRSTTTIDDSLAKIEWVEVTVDIGHSSPADLEIVLISPDGTRSVLAEASSVAKDHMVGSYNYWTLTSPRYWGEASQGEWTIEVRDVLFGESGTLRSWELNVFGTAESEGPGPGPGPVAMVGPELVALVPNQGGTIVNGTILDIAPRELTLKFNEQQVIDSSTLGAIRIVRAGGDAKIGNANDVVVNYGWIGIGERPNEVIVRFAETLPDDMYMITIIGDGSAGDVALMNVQRGVFHQGKNLSITFTLDLGAQIVSIVPQPTYRDAGGNLQQHRDQIEIYFNNDTLNVASAQNTNFYRLSQTNETATTQDDVEIQPISAVYDPATNKVVLTFASDLADFGAGSYRLRIGDEYQEIATSITEAYVVGDTLASATNVGVLGTATQGQSIVISSAIEALPYDLQWPGAITEIGHRELPSTLAVEAHLGALSADQQYGTAIIYYNFKNVYGQLPNGSPAYNLITPEQKQRAREIFELYGAYLGVTFIEDTRTGTNAAGLTIATGDLRVLSPTIPTGPGGVAGLAGSGLAIMDQAESWVDGYGQNWFRTAMHEIGHLLGFGHTYDMPIGTIMGSSGGGEYYDASVEPLFPGNVDIIHGLHVYRPDSIDVDVYRFEIATSGTFSAETVAERLERLSLLDSVVTLHDAQGRIIARNDDYYSEDSYLEVELGPGVYYVTVASTGNTEYDLDVAGSGLGGTTQGNYDLRMTFVPSVVESNRHLVDATGTLFDGDSDGVPGGVHNFWFNVQTIEKTLFVDKTSDGVGQLGSLDNPYRDIDDALAAAQPGDIVRIVGNRDRTFDAQMTYDVSVKPAGTAVGDVTGDGIADIIVTNENDGSISLLRGIGDGTYWAPITYLVGTTPGAVTLADLDNDGDLDVVVVNQGSNTLSLLLNNGNGIFNQQITRFTGSQPTDVELADLNGDGVLDIVVTNRGSNDVSVLLSDPNVMYRDQVRYALGAGAAPAGVALADMNNDGRIDIITANQGLNTVAVLINRDKGVFNTPVFFAAGAGPSAVAVADLDGDGNRDVVAANRNGNDISVLMGLGTGGLAAQVKYAVGAEPGSLGVADLDGDGLPDVVTANYADDTVSVLFGLGTGAFESHVVYNVGDKPTGLTLADIDGDGRPDIITANQGDDEISVLRARRDQAYLVGRTKTNQVLADGVNLNVPFGVTLMVDAGAVFKVSRANINVGSASLNVDNSQGALQVLGTPQQSVYFTSYYDRSLGSWSDQSVLNPSVNPGDWGGLVFRNNLDYEVGRTVLETEGIFLNHVNNAEIRYGGGLVSVNGVSEVYNPIHMVESRPTLTFNTIVRSADAAMSADPNSFADSKFHGEDFTADYDRVGPDIHGNLITDNSINGLFVRIRTDAGTVLDRLNVSARWDDTDIVHVVQENLLIAGTPGGPASNGQTLTARYDARLAIDPGIIVKLGYNRIETQIGAQLLAEGTAALPIIFTSKYDDTYGIGGTFDTDNGNRDPNERQAAPGDWGGLFFGPVSSGSIDHAVITYAGGETRIPGGFAKFNPVEIHQANVRIANSTLAWNTGATTSDRAGRPAASASVIFVRGAQPVVVDNVIRDNTVPAMSINANALKFDRVADWGRSTGYLDAFAQYADNHGPLVRGNALANNGVNGMVVRGEVLSIDSVWDDTDIVHVVYDEIVVPNFHTYGGLRLQSAANQSLVVKLLGENAGFTALGTPQEIEDRIGGTLQIVGAPGYPVVLTSLHDDSIGAGRDPWGNPQNDTDNAVNSPIAGDWRSVKLERYVNDRNVAVVLEGEAAHAGGNTNDTPHSAQFVGSLAPNMKSGDENLRLGFDVHGFIAGDDSNDADVYSFTARAGTEVWIDIDRTTMGLDSIVELIDANGNVLASSRSSTAEEAGLIAPVGLARTMNRDAWSGTGDMYTTNVHDAGMRLVLPGVTGSLSLYYVRVRSADNTGDGKGDSSGAYQLQVRIREDQEIAGSTVQYSSIRYATSGIEMLGLPTNSPLVTDTAEIEGTVQTTVGARASAPVQVQGNFNDFTVTAAVAGVAFNDVWIVFVNGGQTGNVADVFYNPAFDNGGVIIKVLFILGDPSATTAATAVAAINAEGTFTAALTASDGGPNNGSGLISPLNTQLGLTSGGINPSSGITNNDTFETAEYLGNLLDTNTGSIKVSGYLTNSVNSITGETQYDIDWYYFSLAPQGTQNISGVAQPNIWNVIFDIDYADGMGRPDTMIYVFDNTGTLIYMSNNSNVGDDQTDPLGVTGMQDLTRGSAGTNDPYLGPIALKDGDPSGPNGATYYVAIASRALLPWAAYGEYVETGVPLQPLLRCEPVNSVTRIADDTIGDLNGDGVGDTNGGALAGSPRYILFPDPTPTELSIHINDFNLSDVTMYVCIGSDIYTFNPFTGEYHYDLTGSNSRPHVPDTDTRLPGATGVIRYGDIIMRDDGKLFTFTSYPDAPNVPQANNVGIFRQISTADGTIANGIDFDDGIMTYSAAGEEVEATGRGINFTAMIDVIESGTRYIYAIGHADVPDVQWLFKFDQYGSPIGPTGEALPTSVRPWREIAGAHNNGRITGLEIIDGFLYAVTDQGWLYQFTRDEYMSAPSDISLVDEDEDGLAPAWTPGLTSNWVVSIDGMTDSVDLNATFGAMSTMRLSGLSAGPPNVEGGAYAKTLFATSGAGFLYAFNQNGTPAPVFLDGLATIPLGVTNTMTGEVVTIPGATGIAFSTLDYNLWHITQNRYMDEGHTITVAPDESRLPMQQGSQDSGYGNYSYWFGLERSATFQHPGTQAYLDDNPGVIGTYDLPGGAKGILTTNTFSLAGYQSYDLPFLYFDYFLETDGATDSNIVTDSARVYISNDGVNWSLLATNIDTPNNVMFTSDDSNPPPVYMVDGSGIWLQAKVNLSGYVGRDNLRLKFEFNTSGSTNVNAGPRENLYTGVYLGAVPGNELVDGDTFTLLSDMTMAGVPQLFEFDMGYSLRLPASAGRAIRDGETLTITDDQGRTVIFEFDKNGQVTGGNTPIQISDVDSTSVVAQAISVAFNTFYDGNVSVVAGDRVYLCRLDKNLAGIPTLPLTWRGAMDVSQGMFSAIEIEGNAPGTVNHDDPEVVPVLVPVDGFLRAEGVAYQVGRTVDAFYAGFYGGEDTGTAANPELFTSVKVDQSLMYLLKRGVADPGKLKYYDALPGETPRAGTQGGNGTQFYFNTQAQDNAYEGWYIDNVVIGFAERGEMVTHAAPDTSFGQVDASQISGYITEGYYQLEIRVSTEYSYWDAMNQITANTRSFDTNDRHTDEMTILAPSSDKLVHLAKFTVSDGVNAQTFRFVSPLLPFTPEDGVIDIFFFAGRRADQVAQSITSAINSATNLNVTASNVVLNNRVGSDRVVLSGATVVTGIAHLVYDQLGEYPTDVVALDLNGDDLLDLIVTTNEYKGTISVLPGPTVYEVGKRPSALDMADVNGDGVYDIVVANSGDGTVSVLLGNVDGSYKSQMVFGVGNEPSDVTLFDMDGDGNLDIVTTNRDDNTVSILYGNGDGTFTTVATLAVGRGPASVAVGDLNGDGFGDIVVANSLDYTVSVLMNLGGAGFAAPVEYRVGRLPVDVKLGDMNRDGELDILTANRADGTVSVLLGNGGGTFGEKADYAAGTEPVALTVDYFNRDDRLDVVVANYSTGSVRVLLGTGLSENALISSTTYSVGAGPSGVVLGDWDGDGVPDIITADYLSHRATVLPSTLGYQLPMTYTTGQPRYRQLKGDSNNEQVQGQIVINSNELLYSLEYGIRYDAGERDGYPHPGSVAPLVKVNSQKLVPGVTIQNNLIVHSGVAGILFSGDPNNQGAPAATPFGKIVNNTIYGNGVDSLLTLLPVGELIMDSSNDGSTSLLDLGFELNFYGEKYTRMYVNNDGTVTFDGPIGNYSSGGFLHDAPIIAPFWGDVDTRAGGEVRIAYGTSARGNAVIQIDWINVGYFNVNGDKRNTFTLYIENDPLGDIVVFAYHDMQWTSGDKDSNGPGNGFGGAGAQVGFDAGDKENFLSVMRPNSAQDLSKLMDRGTYVWRLAGEAGTPVAVSNDSGILVVNNASPTILNNIVANVDVGILVDGTSRTTVLGANVYQRNGLNAVGMVESGTAVILGPDDPLFVDAANGNFYLAAGSKAIDSAVNSLEERVAMAEVRDPLGIARSPILAPDHDLYGQQRVDDPSAQPPSGSGSNVFKDRGAIDRVDFDRPTATITDPLDNDPAGIDVNPAIDQVFVIGQPTPVISIQLNDGLSGAGIYDYSVKSSKVHVYVSGREEPLVAGVDYFFRYDAANDIISLIAAAGLWEQGKAYTIVLDNSANGIMDIAGNPLQANQLDGTATYVVALTHIDFGDAPDPAYPTKLENDGARHLLIGDYYLGHGVTGEADANLAVDRHGNPINDATGDEMDDGVFFTSALLTNSVVTLQVRASRAGYLNAWIDLNGDGDFDDAGEHVIARTLARGLNEISFVLPEGQFIGDTFARFRFTSTSIGPSVGPRGLAINGEVEDYKVTIVDVLRDYGDAPAPYPTLLADNGARHELGGGLFLGGRVDDELDGQPDADARGDDKNGLLDHSGPQPVVLDDEDGVEFVDWLIPGQVATVKVIASMSGGYLNAWIDFDGDGVWSPDEKIADGTPLAAGVNTVVFTVPSTAQGTIIGHTFARFRLSSEVSLEPTGAAADGEVEDYKVIIAAEPRDYGDAPRSYATVEKSEAAFAQLILPGYDNDMLIRAVTQGAEMNGIKVNIVNDRAIGDIAFVSYDATTKVLLIDVDPLRTTAASVVAAINTQQGARFEAELNDLVDKGNDGSGLIKSVGTVGVTAHGQDGSGEDAAYHVLWPAAGQGARGLFLGKLVDAELDGQPDHEALGDDKNDLDDEDGITLPEQFMAGQQTNITVEVHMGDATAAYLSAWVDLNMDGVFTEGEQVLFDVPVVDGFQTIPVTIPMNASVGTTFARFRLSTEQGLSFGGAARDGEVEDYQVVLARGSAAINGWVFEDRNNNGRFDVNEKGISGVTVFIDLNENGILDKDIYGVPVEPYVVSMTDNLSTTGVNETGYYEFNGLIGRTEKYVVRVVDETLQDWVLTYPDERVWFVDGSHGNADHSYDIFLEAHERLEDVNFGSYRKPSVAVSDIWVVEGHQGYTEVQVTITLTDSFGAPVEVHYHTIDGTATTQDGDYIAATGKITIDPRETPPPTWDTYVLTTTSTSDYDFGVSGNYVVWEGFDGNDWEIFLAIVDVSLGTFDVIQLTDNATNDRFPHVFATKTGVNVVWVGSDGNDDEVFAYSLNNGVATTRQVTDNSYNDRDPRVSDSLITWWGNDGRSDQIFVFEIDELGDADARPVNLTDNMLQDRNPQISGRNIVWTRGSGGADTEIMAYHGDENPLDAPKVIQVTTNSRIDQWPRIDGDKIVWESQVTSTYEIFLYDMTTEATTRITTNSTHDRYPDISGNDVVWRGNTGSNWEIYHYNAIAQTAPKNISNTPMFSEEEPRIQGSQVVWRAFNGSTYDVYYYDLNLGTGAVNVTNTPGAEWKPAVSDSLLVWRAAHGSNYDIVIGLKNQPVASQTITLRVVGDKKYELDEYFVLAIDVDNDLVSIRDGKNQAVVTILNDDGVLDFGDAPAPYPTLLVDNGARHRIVAGIYLGDPAGPQSAYIDAELNGQPTAAADGDNRNLSNDEQGVAFNTAIAQGTVASITVTASTYGYIDAWLDFNRDGDWDDAGEHIFDAAFVEPGANTLYFQVPAGAVVGDSYARFRFSTIGGLAYTGQADNGEVEDYMVAIVSRPPIVNRAVSVSGTDGDDLFEFFAGETLTVIINGAVYSYLATEVDTISFDGGAGTDTVIFHGSAADESVEMWSNKAKFQGPHGGGYLVDTINVEVMRAAAGGGSDNVTMRGAAGDDTFEGRPGLATMTGTGYSLEATNFNQVLAVAGIGGSDSALLRGSTGNDTFVGRPKFGSIITGAGEVVTAEGFYTTRAFSEGHTAGDPAIADRAYLYDSSESDTFRSTPTQARMEPTLGSGYYLEANGFRYVEAYSQNGGPDYANLYDSAGADKFTGYPHYAQLKDKANALYQVTVNGFRYVAAIGTSHAGDDAEFFDSAGSDTFEADPTYALLKGANFYLRADKFPTVRAVGGEGGEDVVHLYDSPGNDLLVASPNDMSLVGAGFKISASNFQHVLAFAGEGNDTARFFGTDGVDTFIGRPGDARLLNAANTFRAYGFDTVQAYGKGGNDEAYLYDTSLGELLKATGSIGDGEDAWAELSNSELNFKLWVADFEYVWVNQMGSGDKKKIGKEVDFVFTQGLWEEI